MAHGGNTQFEWLDQTPKWDDGRKRVWLKWKWYDPYFTGELTKYLDHFEIQIRYSFKNANGGIETQQKSPESMSDFRDGDYNFNYYWEVPAECLTVEFAIHAIAKTDSQNGGSVPYFEDDPWPAPPFYCGDATVPDKPSAPSVSHNAQIGTQVVLGLDNVRDGDNNKNVVQVEFQTVYYDTDPETELGEGIKVQRTEKAKVDEFGNARALVYIGNKYGYKFRARLCGVRDKDAGGTIERQIEVFSEWSELTDIVLGVPERPAITVRKYTDVVAEYQIKAKNSYDHYQIQSAQTLETFDLFDDWEREYPQFKENSDERTAALQNYGVNERSVESQNGWIRDLTTLEAGKAYWRVRSVTAQSDGFYSTWSEPFELTFGEKLRAPIVSMGSQFATLDDTSIQLIIRHNSPNGSPTCRCDIYLRVGAGSGNIPYFDTIRPEDMNVGQNNDGSYTYYYNLNLKDRRISLQKEDTITWYAYTFEGNRASESVETRSYQSEYVTFWVYETPSVELAILSQNGESMPVEEGQYILPGFPIRLVTTSNLGEKKVVSWNIRIIPTISYYNTGRHGEREVVNAGSVLYNQIDVKTPTDLDKLILANEVSLDQGVVYILEVTAAINTGVTVTTTAEFKMVFTGAKVSIECASSYNFDNISLGLCPSVWKEEGTGLLPPPSYEDEYWVPSLIGGSLGVYYNGDRVWNAGDKTYYSYRSNQYEFDRENNEWIPKTWNGLTNFDGYNVWTDGENIYYSYSSNQYVLDADTDTWVAKTWNGLSSFSGMYVWTDGTDIYYSNGSQQYVLNKDTGTWVTKTWNGLSSLGANFIWTDGEYFYFSIQTGSDTATHYILDVETSTWSIKTWEGNSFFTGDRVWTDGYNVYVSSDQYGINTDQFKLNKDTDSWETITWEVHDGPTTYNVRTYAGYMWRDNGIIYFSSSATHLKFIMPEPEPEPTTAKVLDPNYTLAVYRKNDDGTFVTIAENLLNTEAAFVTDPHPNLGGSEYRIVATDTTTGQMTFYDPPPYDMKCTDIILQWDEEYADIPFNDDSRETIRQFGSFVRLPYNIDVSESANMENSMVNYIGRKNPVSYYGTQTGYTASWSTEIPKYDTQTIKMLRRLQVYPGDVYVREPSGTGYWAHVTVSFPINHCALTVSVSLSITRVEGGM